MLRWILLTTVVRVFTVQKPITKMCEKALGLKIIDSLVVNFVDLENHLSTWEEEIVPEKNDLILSNLIIY